MAKLSRTFADIRNQLDRIEEKLDMLLGDKAEEFNASYVTPNPPPRDELKASKTPKKAGSGKKAIKSEEEEG